MGRKSKIKQNRKIANEKTAYKNKRFHFLELPYCISCGKKLSYRDVFSNLFLARKGRCTSCKENYRIVFCLKGLLFYLLFIVLCVGINLTMMNFTTNPWSLVILTFLFVAAAFFLLPFTMKTKNKTK